MTYEERARKFVLTICKPGSLDALMVRGLVVTLTAQFAEVEAEVGPACMHGGRNCQKCHDFWIDLIDTPVPPVEQELFATNLRNADLETYIALLEAALEKADALAAYAKSCWSRTDRYGEDQVDNYRAARAKAVKP